MKEEHDFLPNIGLTNLRRRTVVNVLKAWREIEGIARHAISHDIRPTIPKDDMPLLLEQMKKCLDSKGGEVTQRAHTADLGRIYLKLNEAGRAKFLKLLAEEFAPDNKKVEELAQNYLKAKDNKEKLRLEIAIRNALVTPRSMILRQFTALPDGFKFLINMREDLLPVIGDDISLKGLEYDLKSILFSWFDIGLLDMQEITWKSPAALLEKLIEYEAVHSVT
ncbi:MAG: malonyl-CoA decarboxylase N-terminal domain-containing protein, partial [Rickettsiales bacterium]